MKALVLVFAIGISGACGPSNQTHSSKQNRFVITEEEIQKTTANNAYELIRSRRPEFLRPQGPKAVTAPPVIGGRTVSNRIPVAYVDGIRYGYLDDLMKIPAESVKEVRYLNESDANLQFGLGHSAGAILITTKK